MQVDYHFIGIGGIGMSALAQILLDQGKIVSGSDLSSSSITEGLQRRGARIDLGHAQKNLPQSGTVIFSTDIKQENVEIKEARSRGLVCWHRAELLAHLLKARRSLLIAGTHGKTSTSALLAHVLMEAHMDPSFAIGGMVKSLHGNGRGGKGSYFVAEADESDGSFLKYTPFGAIVTNIDNDHFDHWKSFEALSQGFAQFVDSAQSKEHVLWCGDDERLSALQLEGISYGFTAGNALRVENFLQNQWQNRFDIQWDGKRYTEIEISLIGAHNVLNSAAVFGMGLQLGISEGTIRTALASFQGVGRRMERKGEVGEILVIDDYAHHPTEIFATLRALKHAIGDRRLVVAFQPHRYTRTQECLPEFSHAFRPADRLVVTDIFSAREAPIAGVTIETLVNRIRADAHSDVQYIPREQLSSQLAQQLKPGDVLMTMGAGDITHVGPEVLSRLS